MLFEGPKEYHKTMRIIDEASVDRVQRSYQHNKFNDFNNFTNSTVEPRAKRM